MSNFLYVNVTPTSRQSWLVEEKTRLAVVAGWALVAGDTQQRHKASSRLML
jgi:hypothetical protein